VHKKGVAKIVIQSSGTLNLD